jgi:tRNA dimethylallyltransferase
LNSMNSTPLPWIIAIEGPTASGKTDLAIQVAKTFQAPIISADARQFYRELRIGVARPKPEELNAVPHYFIADRSVTEGLSAGSFEREALDLLKKLFNSHPVVVVAGGSGLYVKALLEGFDHFPPVPESVTQELQNTYATEGLSALQFLLQKSDPEYFATVDQNNPHRLIRALAVCQTAGRPYSSFRKNRMKERPFNTLRIGLKRERTELYQRINDRVDHMMEEGLEEEARTVLEFRKLSPLSTVGYQEMFAYFEGLISLPQTIDLIKQNTRRYAKRQMTWLRSQQNLTWFPAGEDSAVNAYLREHISSRT